MQPEHLTVLKMNLRNYSREYLEKIAISIKRDIFNNHINAAGSSN